MKVKYMCRRLDRIYGKNAFGNKKDAQFSEHLHICLIISPAIISPAIPGIYDILAGILSFCPLADGVSGE